MRAQSCLILTASLLLAACNKSGQPSSQAVTPSAESMQPGIAMAPAPGSTAKKADGEGTVTAIDNAAGTISIEHGAIAAASWPAMTMAFKADDAMRKQVAVGDKVDFSFETTGDGGTLTKIEKK